MLTRFTVACCLVLLLVAEQAFSQTLPLQIRPLYVTTRGSLKTAITPQTKNLPKLGLALAGGGARAASSIGVLKVLVQEGIPVAAIAGTSMGAGVGGFFAAGYSPEQIESIFSEYDWNDIFSDTPRRVFLTQEQKEAGSRHLLEFTFYRGRFMPPSGLSAGQKLTNLLADKTLAASFEADMDFDRLRIPFRAVATDIESGDTVVLGRGLLHEAMRASAALPLVFQPVEIDGRMLVDGGLVNNLPVSVARSMGVDVVIAVDASAGLEKKEQLTSLLEIMGQSISLQVRRESIRQAALADLVITPDTSMFSFADFPAMHLIMKQGEEAARAALPRIRELMRPKVPDRARAERYRITSLSVRGNSLVSEATIRYALSPILFPQEPSYDDIYAGLVDLFQLGYFNDVALSLEKDGEGALAVLTVEENPVVRSIEISGNTLVPTADILSAIAWQQGTPLNSIRLSSELDRIVASCRDKGFLLTRIARAGMKPDNRTLELVFYEGRVDSITLSGQRTTKRSVIQRETATRAGSPLNFHTAALDIQQLYALNYFESVSADMAKSPQGGIDVTLRIREKPTSKVRFGLRYDLDDRFTGLTDVIVDNVTGRGIKAYLNTRYGNYTDLTLGYQSPVFLDANFIHSVQAFFRKRQYPVYVDKHQTNVFDLTRTGAEALFGYQWFRFGDTYLRYRYATDSMTETNGLDPASDNVRIGSLAFLTTLDTRDEHPFPQKGMLFKGSHEIARIGLGSSGDFTRSVAQAQGNVTFAERHTLTLEATGGLGIGELPYQERFGIGGMGTLLAVPLAGYQRREFIGANMMGFSAAYRWKIKEYQLKAIRAIYLNVVGQEANVWDSRDEMSINHLRSGAGIGLHADTIIGPVRLDVGSGSQHRTAVYFSAGFDF